MRAPRHYLTPNVAASKLLGWTGDYRGKRLVKLIESREKEIGREIMRRRKSAQRTFYYVTEALIRRHLPELFLKTEEDLTVEVRLHLDRVKVQLEESLDQRIAAVIADLRAEDRRLHRRLDAVEGRK